MGKTFLLTGKTGCGKSTIMHRLVDDLHINTLKHLYLVSRDSLPHKYYYCTNNNGVYILGKYVEGKTSGIDAYFDKELVADVISHIFANDENATIICEGWRYKNIEFDEVYYLHVSNEKLYENLKDRFASGNRRCKPNTLKALNDYDYFCNNYIKKYKGIENRAIKNNWELHKHETEDERELNYQNILKIITNE